MTKIRIPIEIAFLMAVLLIPVPLSNGAVQRLSEHIFSRYC